MTPDRPPVDLLTAPDEVIREVRAHREALAAEHGFDVRAILEHLRSLVQPNEATDQIPAAADSDPR